LDPGREVAVVPGRQEANSERGWLVAIGSHNRHIGKVATARDEVVVMVPPPEGFILAGRQGRGRGRGHQDCGAHITKHILTRDINPLNREPKELHKRLDGAIEEVREKVSDLRRKQ